MASQSPPRRGRRWPAFLAGLLTGEALTVAVAWLYPIVWPLALSWAEPVLGTASVEAPAPPAVAPRPAAPGATPSAAPPLAPPVTPAPRPRFDGPPPDDWGGPKVAMLPQELGHMGPSLKMALDRAREEDMAFCFRGRETETPRRAADLMLYLETRDGVVDVVDARVARPGRLPSEVVDCCLEVLRGMELKVFFVVPGQRFRYVHEIEE